MSAARSTGHGRIVDVLGGLDTGAVVSLLFASGATIEGSLEEVSADGAWAVVLERVTVDMPPSDERTMTTRHTIDVGALVAVGEVDP